MRSQATGQAMSRKGSPELTSTDSWTDEDRIALLNAVHDGKITVDQAVEQLLTGGPDRGGDGS